MPNLEKKRRPLTAKEITKSALEKNLIETSGKTPAATMAARLYTNIKKKGANSLFTKVKGGKFFNGMATITTKVDKF